MRVTFGAMAIIAKRSSMEFRLDRQCDDVDPCW